MAGDMWIDPKIVEQLAARPVRPSKRSVTESLTERERVVIDGLLEGLTNKRIAERLNVTEGAIKATLQNLFEKMNVRTRAQLVRVALEGQGVKNG
jgi:two-component system, NarL family, nitrate/nitrite response regulator NarL